jgi:Pentapeptide repeats (8 copies)
MPETLLTPSSIKMYGRTVTSLTYTDDTQSSTIGCNNFLQRQLECTRIVSITGTITEDIMGKKVTINDVVSNIVASNPQQHLGLISKGMMVSSPDPAYFQSPTSITEVFFKGRNLEQFTVFPRPLKAGNGIQITVSIIPNFARIYAFSFEGAIYSLPRPSMFLVHGPGNPVDLTGTASGHWGGTNLGRTTLDASGVFAREWEFSAAEGENNFDLRYWEYEKGDFSIRLDAEAGQLEQILLMAALRAGADMADRATAIRSGASLAGASLSGASLSGASLSGASLSGASLSGASLRNGR